MCCYFYLFFFFVRMLATLFLLNDVMRFTAGWVYWCWCKLHGDRSVSRDWCKIEALEHVGKKRCREGDNTWCNQEVNWTKGVKSEMCFNLVVPKHFYMYSNPEIIIDKSRAERWRCQCAYIAVCWFENAVIDEMMTKPLAIVLNEKHAVNATGFGDA